MIGKTFAERGDCFALRARNDTPCPRLPGVFAESKPQSLFHRQNAAAVPNPLELPRIHVLTRHIELLLEIGLPVYTSTSPQLPARAVRNLAFTKYAHWIRK